MSPLGTRVHPHPHGRRWLWFGLPTLLALFLVLAYVFLDLIVAYATQKGLDRVDGAAGWFKRVHVTLLHPGYDVYGLTIVQMPLAPKKEPLFYAERVEMRWSWRELFHGHLVRRINVVRARVMVPIRSGDKSKPSQPPLEIAKTLESVPSAGLQRLALVDSQVVLVDEIHSEQRLWFHAVALTIENIASRRELMHGLPILVGLHSKLQRTGTLAVFLTIDPFDKGYTFAGSAELHHLALADLHDFTKIKGLSITAGKMDAFVSVTCKRNKITGGVKPVLTNVHIEPADEHLGDRIKAALADIAVRLFSDRVPGRNAVAAIIPIRGDLSDLAHLDVQRDPAIAAVFRNAFVVGLSESLSETPPPASPKKEGLVRQVIHGLEKKNPKPVKTQPKP